MRANPGRNAIVTYAGVAEIERISGEQWAGTALAEIVGVPRESSGDVMGTAVADFVAGIEHVQNTAVITGQHGTQGVA
jgi:hypothetical protein